MQEPVVTVGMPVYNNARTIARALESLRAQTEQRIQIVISDDGSTDDTVEIVSGIARQDPRIVLVRQPRNLNYGNFRFVLSRANTPYFMFAAGDDWWEPDFVQQCLTRLEQSPDAVGVVTRVLMHPVDHPPYLSIATAEIRGDPRSRLAAYLGGPDDNSRMYGVFRSEAARRAFPRSNHHAYDWTFSAATLLHGDHLEVPSVGLHREVTENERYTHYVRRDASGALDRFFPLGPMTRSLLFEHHIPLDRRVLAALYYLNKGHHEEYLRVFHPRVLRAYAIIGRLTRRLRFWRRASIKSRT